MEYLLTVDTPAGTTHRATLENGPNVVNGRLIWTSATGITVADPNAYAGCQRRWWFEQVDDKKGPPTEAMLGGTALHSEIEDHLRTGARLTSPLALSGRMFIPQPGGNLAIERPIHFKTKIGVDIYGHVDLYNFRQEYIDSDGALQRDPSWSFEVKDWKTTSDFQYAKTARELADNIQLVTYAEAGLRFMPDADHARLTHVYFRTKGRPESKLVTILRSREEINARWDYAESVVRTMVDVAREPTAETVPGNHRSCEAYRGCPHRARCSAYQRTSLDAIYGKVAEDHLKEKQVGIIANTPGLMQPAPTQPTMQASLAQEEQALRAQVAQQQMQMPQNDLLQVCHRLGSYGFGMPSLAGNAAQAYAQAGGQNVAPGFVYPGVMAAPGAQYSLHAMTLTEVGQIYQIEREAAAKIGAPAPTFPPPAPYAPPVAPPVQPQYGGVLPPGTPESMPQLAQARPPMSDVDPGAHGGAYVEPQQPAEKKTRGRPKKEATGTAPEAVAPPQATQTATQAPTAPTAPVTQVTPVAAPTYPSGLASGAALVSDTTGALESTCVLVNARFAGKATKSLAGYVDYINGELSKRYSITSDGKPGIQDVRCVPKDSPLAFGGWKGAVREVVKADPPGEGLYHLDTFMDELNEVVADALRVVAEQRGWLYVRGVR